MGDAVCPRPGGRGGAAGPLRLGGRCAHRVRSRGGGRGRRRRREGRGGRGVTRPGQPPRRGLCRPGAPDALQDQRLPAVRACNLVSSDTARLPYAIYLMPSQDQKGCKGLHSGKGAALAVALAEFIRFCRTYHVLTHLAALKGHSCLRAVCCGLTWRRGIGGGSLSHQPSPISQDWCSSSRRESLFGSGCALTSEGQLLLQGHSPRCAAGKELRAMQRQRQAIVQPQFPGMRFLQSCCLHQAVYSYSESLSVWCF